MSGLLCDLSLGTGMFSFESHAELQSYISQGAFRSPFMSNHFPTAETVCSLLTIMVCRSASSVGSCSHRDVQCAQLQSIFWICEAISKEIPRWKLSRDMISHTGRMRLRPTRRVLEKLILLNLVSSKSLLALILGNLEKRLLQWRVAHSTEIQMTENRLPELETLRIAILDIFCCDEKYAARAHGKDQLVTALPHHRCRLACLLEQHCTFQILSWLRAQLER